MLIYQVVRVQELVVDQISYVHNIQHNNYAIKILMETRVYGYKLQQLNLALIIPNAQMLSVAPTRNVRIFHHIALLMESIVLQLQLVLNSHNRLVV